MSTDLADRVADLERRYDLLEVREDERRAMGGTRGTAVALSRPFSADPAPAAPAVDERTPERPGARVDTRPFASIYAAIERGEVVLQPRRLPESRPHDDAAYRRLAARQGWTVHD